MYHVFERAFRFKFRPLQANQKTQVKKRPQQRRQLEMKTVRVVTSPTWMAQWGGTKRM